MTVRADVWDALAALVDYPADDSYRDRVDRCLAELGTVSPPAVVSLVQLRQAIDAQTLGALQERYVTAFDFDAACALEIGWHVHADARQRGPWLAALRENLARRGVIETGELPDHLAHLLMLIPREDEPRARELVTLVAPVLDQMRDRLAARSSEFAHLLGAVRALLDTRFDGTENGHD